MSGRRAQALRTYEASAPGALPHGYVQHAALAHEPRPAVLNALRRGTQAAQGLQRALALYEQWGAHAVVARIRAELAG
mgnify:CR=1 FL=1